MKRRRRTDPSVAGEPARPPRDHTARILRGERELSDEELLRAWARGDRAAGQALVVRHEQAVRAYVARRVRSSVDVDDIVQQTFLACMTGGDAFRGEGCARAFVLAIARNQIFMAWRRDRRMARWGDDLDPDACPTPPAEGVSEVRATYVASAVEALPCHLREPLHLMYWDGLTRRGAAERANLPPGTVASRVRIAKSRLRRLLRRGREDT